MKKRPKIIIPVGAKPFPHEVAVARIVADHFNVDVKFIVPRNGYKVKTPDILMRNKEWEIKSPTGNSKKATIGYQFKGLKQSRNLIIDGQRTNLTDEFIIQQIKFEMKKHKRVGTVLFIDKLSRVMVL
jgi:hypothetical protein